MSDRPERVQITDELGKFKSLAQGPGAYHILSRGKDVLIMGLSPNPPDAAEAAGPIAGDATVRYVEDDSFLSQMPAARRQTIPQTWRRIQPGEVDEFLIHTSTVVLYSQAQRLFPSFYGPLAARVRLALLRPGATSPATPTVILAAEEHDLLAPELTRAFARAGLDVLTIEPGECARRLPGILAQDSPALFFSVNFRGLDPLGETFHLLHAAHVPVGVWLVDNPFHVLSALRSPYWRRVPLFVTDDFFIPLLEKHGARHVTHLPLATDPQVMDRGAGPDFPGLAGRVVFVGRSEFPHKAGFFAGANITDSHLEEAREALRMGRRPGYGWWLEKLGTHPLWPGASARQAGFGAETLARDQRAMVLSELSALPLTVFGDDGWHNLVPGLTDLRAPVDYYTTLPGVYSQAGISVNVTSLLLPHGLTQRHFDVWAAGGTLITDNTPGLSLFPEDMTREIVFDHPDHAPVIASRLLEDSALRADLKAAWRSLILAEHTFDNRTAVTLDTLGVTT